jgi:hypothetical protein
MNLVLFFGVKLNPDVVFSLHEFIVLFYRRGRGDKMQEKREGMFDGFAFALSKYF